MLSMLRVMKIEIAGKTFEIKDIVINLMNNNPTYEIKCIVDGNEKYFYSIDSIQKDYYNWLCDARYLEEFSSKKVENSLDKSIRV